LETKQILKARDKSLSKKAKNSLIPWGSNSLKLQLSAQTMSKLLSSLLLLKSRAEFRRPLTTTPNYLPLVAKLRSRLATISLKRKRKTHAAEQALEKAVKKYNLFFCFPQK